MKGFAILPQTGNGVPETPENQLEWYLNCHLSGRRGCGLWALSSRLKIMNGKAGRDQTTPGSSGAERRETWALCFRGGGAWAPHRPRSCAFTSLPTDAGELRELWVGRPAFLGFGFAICKRGIITFSHQRSEVKKRKQERFCTSKCD